MRQIFLGLVVAIWVAVPGCGVARSRVHGTVKYQGKPLSGAVITFFGSDNMTYSADTQADGTYEVDGVPRGTVRVSVQLLPPRSQPRPDPDLRKARDTFAKEQAKADDQAKMARLPETPPPAPPPGTTLPIQYSNPNTSGLSFELKEANQEYSIDLK